ncbi:MAG TPA: hypothetical protein VGR98_06415, partial [Streptosporangiaceae bacterium]|nr:hypothetical protein [Streptosporangiaceae bacterium]
MRARWLIGFIAAMVAVPVLAVASLAGATTPPWTIQPTANPGTYNLLGGVSCPSATVCAAAGYDFVGKDDAMSQVWNGTAWQIPFLVKGDPLFSATKSFLYAASCPTATSCEMVGNYQSGATLPLAVLWNGKLGRVSVSSQPVEVPPGATYTQLSGVSCPSVSACTAVGFYNDSAGQHTLAEQWDGSRWARQASGTTHGAFNAVSCTSATFCVAVGDSGAGQLAEIWNGSTWAFSLGGIWNGGTLNTLNGVSCTADGGCVAVGYIVNASGSFTLGVQRTTTGTWKLLNTTNPGATGNAFFGVTCPPAGGCLAVGYYLDGRGVIDTLAEHWSGLNWSMESTPVPLVGHLSFLFGVSCSSADACTAVGIHTDLKGNTLTLAERFESAGSPHGFSLTQGGTVLALLRKPRALGLLVFQLGRHGHLLGLVPLGNHPRGLSRIRWNLRVGGQRLRAGTYLAELVATFGRGVTSDGPAVTFDLTRAGQV